MATLRAALLLIGEGDLVAVARQLHRRAFGDASPFVVSDPRRRRLASTARSAENRRTAMQATERASGGTLCVWASRLPADFAEARARLSDPDRRTRLIVCAHHGEHSIVNATAAIVLTPLSERTHEIDLVIEEYAADAIITLGAKPSSFTSQDLEWLRRRKPGSLADIERAVERLVAIREWGGVTRAAAHLGISHVALSRWFGRRR